MHFSFSGGVEEENQHEKSQGGLSVTVCLRGCACQCGSRILYSPIKVGEIICIVADF